ncbi:MAG: DUF4240 domain-containing protein [Bacteroidota bacterium]
MTAILKVKVADLTMEWLEQVKANYAGAEVEFRINELPDESLTEKQFWEIIDLLNWEAEEDLVIIAPAVERLSTYSLSQIYTFQEILTNKLYHLDTPDHAKAIGSAAYQKDHYFSVDHFLYARACVIANGRAAYETALARPEEMPKDLTFEPLLRIASDAYERKTDKTFHYATSLSYETYSNKAAWETEV